MGMIQQIDGTALINAFRQGRADRFEQVDREAKARKQQADAERQSEMRGLMGQLFTGGSQGGVAGQVASSNPSSNVPAASFDQAFSAPNMEAIGRGESPPVAAPSSGGVAGAAAPTNMAAPRFNPQILARLIALDPDTGSKIASAFKTLDETDLKRQQTKNDIMGSAASYAQQGTTMQERQARFQHAIPQLLAAGWSQQELEVMGHDLSDQSLGGYQALAIEYDKKIDNELAARQEERQRQEMLAGKTVSVAPGGNVAIVKPVIGEDGSVGTSTSWAIGGGPQGGTNIARPQSKAEFDALPPGATFIAPDGTTRTKPGGPTQPASGGF